MIIFSPVLVGVELLRWSRLPQLQGSVALHKQQSTGCAFQGKPLGCLESTRKSTLPWFPMQFNRLFSKDVWNQNKTRLTGLSRIFP